VALDGSRRDDSIDPAGPRDVLRGRACWGRGCAQGTLPGPLPNERWQYIPQRMWNRILQLGSAYELHFAAVLEPVVDTVLDPTQCETVDEELRFLAALLNDDALKSALSIILGEVAKVRGRSGMALVFSPP
jgi:hypothetical protein